MVKVSPTGTAHRTVAIPTSAALLAGDLHLPEDPHGVVLLAHGSGSSRHSPRNQQVAAGLRAGASARS
jgi:putative phosphoribosyl transferase